MSPVSSTCQIHPTAFIDSFQASLSRFSGYRVQFLRRNHSNPHKKHHFSSNLRTISSAPFPERNPQTKSNLVAENRKNGPLETPISQTPSNGSFPNGKWMDKWSGTQFQNLPKRPKAVLDYRNGGVSSEDDEGSGSTSTSASTMDRIVEKLKRFGYVDDMIERNERVPERGSVEDIFYVEEGMLPNSRGGFPAESPLGVENSDNGGDGRSLFPWEKRPLNEEAVRNSVRMRRSKTSVAELTLPESELRRLRHLAVAMKSRMKIGGAGVTKAIVDAIHEKWKLSEVVRLKCEGPPTLNMKRLHEILEDKNAHAVLPIKTDQDTLREGYRFIRSEEDDMDPSWEQRLVKRYYAKLFKEYCIADMSQYKTGKIGLRWRIEKEVISGKGQFICGNRKCNETDGLASYEVNFSYFEAGENKQALVKLVACKGCAEKLMYKRKKEKERLEKSETEKHKRKREKTRSDGSTDDEYDGSNERKKRGHMGSSSTNDETIDADNNFEEFLVGMFP